jgi:REP element-mobilizing transposase RayT
MRGANKMARKRRYHIAGAFYHVMLRGNNKQKIFFSEEDRYHLCGLIKAGIAKYGHRIHAFCLMDNHIHLLIQVQNIPLSKIIHNLAFRYTQYINQQQQKIGHLFQGRFKAILIQEMAYFLRLLRYIHMNPVRAKIVKEPEHYPWSGHRAYLGQVELNWFTINYGLKKFANDLDDARMKYRNYLLKTEQKEGLQELQHGFKEGQILGDDTFLDDMLKMKKETPHANSAKISIQEILKAICCSYDIDMIALVSPLRTKNLSLIRGAAISFASKQGYSLTEMGKAFNRSTSSSCRLMLRFTQKYAVDLDIQNRYHHFEEMAKHFSDSDIHT